MNRTQLNNKKGALLLKINAFGCLLFFISMVLWGANGMFDIVFHNYFWLLIDIGGFYFSIWGYLYHKRAIEKEAKS